MMFQEQKAQLLEQVAQLARRRALAGTVGPDYFEPGMMEYLEQSEGLYDAAAGKIQIRFEARGTRYEGRTEQIEKVKPGDPVELVREPENPFNANNFTLLTGREWNVGNMPAELCNAIAPLYDGGYLTIDRAFVSFVDPISKRSRHAKQAILFVELHMTLQTP